MFFPEIESVDEIERIARRVVARDFRAVRAVLAQRRHRRLDRRRHFARSRHQHRSSDARRRHRHVPRQVERRRPALPVRRRARRRASAEDRDRKGADRGRPARRLRARLPAADEPGHRRSLRRRGAAALEPSARRPALAGHLHPDRRADRRHRRDRRLGDWRGRRVLGNWHRNGFDGRLAFNISPRQVDRADFFVKLRQAFADADVPLSMVELEFTESAAMEVSEAVLDEIAALRDDGARDRDRRFRHRLFEHRAAALDAARPGQARPVADRRHRHIARRRGWSSRR